MAETLGTYLREQRLQRGLTLEAIAKETRVPLQYLQGLEEDNLSKLPAAIVLAKAYLRSYVRCLRLSASVEDHAMAYLSDAMVAARGEHNPSASERRTGPLAAVMDLYYGILVTWTLRRQQCFDAMLARTARFGQWTRNVATNAKSGASATLQVARRHSTALGTQLLHQARRASIHLALWLHNRVTQALRPAGATLTTAWQACMSASLRILRGAMALSRTGACVAWSLLLRRRGQIVVLRAAAGTRLDEVRATVRAGLIRTANLTVRGWLRSAAIVMRFLGAAPATISSLLSSSITRMLSVASLLSSISILLLITVARAASRFSSRAIAKAGTYYDSLGESPYLSQSVSPLGEGQMGLEAWYEAAGRSAHSNPQGTVRSTYLTSTIVSAETRDQTNDRSRLAGHSAQLSIRERYRRERMKFGAWDMRAWYWVANYIVALSLAVILASILGDAPLFKSTVLGDPSLNASRLVQFIGYGAALVLFLLLGLRVAAQIPDTPVLSAIIRRLMTPLVTLVTCSGLYNILLLLGDAFMSKSGRQIYDWAFVALIMASAAWVTMAGFWTVHNAKEESETAANGAGSLTGHSEAFCPHCQTTMDAGMRFCGYCGSTIS